MSGVTAAKIRYVRCPKCKNILPEPPDVPVYECACCHTRLQAKVRKNDAGNTLPSSGELDAAQVNKAVHVTKDKLAEDKAVHSGDCSVDQRGGSDLVKSDNRNGEHPFDIVKSRSGDHSDGGGHEESGELDGGGIILSVENLNNGKDGSKFGDSNDEQIRGVNILNQDPENNGDESETRNRSVEQPAICSEASSPSGFGEAKDENFSLTREQDDKELNGDSSQSALPGADIKSTMKTDESDESETCNRNVEQTEICNEAFSSNGYGEGKNGELISLSGRQDGKEVNDGDSQSAISDVVEQTEICNEAFSSNGYGEGKNGELISLSGRQDGKEVNDGDSQSAISDVVEQTEICNEAFSSNGYGEGKNGELISLSGRQDGKELNDGDSQSAISDVVEQTEICNEAFSSNGYGEGKNGELISLSGRQDGKELNDGDSQSAISDVVEQTEICNEAFSSNGYGEGKNGELISLSGRQDGKELNDGDSQSAISDIDNQRSREFDATDGIALSMTSHQPEEEMLSGSLPSHGSEQPHEDAQLIMNLEKFGDTGETVDFFNPSSELSGTLVDLSKSPTTRSTQAYYDDGISSNDGTDDQLPDRWRNSLSSAHKPANLVASNERPRKEKFLVNSFSEIRHQYENHPSTFSDQMHDANSINWLNRGRVYNPDRVGHSDQWGRLEDGNPSRMPFYHDDVAAGYESSSPSYQFQNEYRWKSNFNRHDKMPYPMEEKARLLRMSYEFQEQLNTRCYPNEIATEQVSAGAKWKSRHIPMFYSREAGERHQHQSERARISFPENVTNIRQQVDCSWCCCSEDSALPPIHTCLHDRGHCRIHAGVRRYNAYGSCSSSPERRMDFLPPMDVRGTKSADQGDRDYGVNKHKKKKQPLVKRYLWPIAGAAPFTICSFCMKQLQLPADFLLIGKRCHRLKCGACGEVDKFSLIDQSHLVPYTPLLEAPPPSEVDDSASRKYMALSSNAHDLPEVDTASWFDEVDDNAGKVSHSLQGNGERGQKFVSSISKNKYMYLDQTHGSARRSSAMSVSKRVLSENVDRAMRGGRPLHHLMGYSSPHQVLFGHDGASSSYASSHLQGELSADEP